MAASRVRATTGWQVDRNGKQVNVRKGDLLHANSPLLRGHEGDVEPADFIFQSAPPPPEPPAETTAGDDTEGEA